MVTASVDGPADGPDWPQPHPMDGDPIESERCPDCGTPGRRVRLVASFGIVRISEWACPDCEPEAFA